MHTQPNTGSQTSLQKYRGAGTLPKYEVQPVLCTFQNLLDHLYGKQARYVTTNHRQTEPKKLITIPVERSNDLNTRVIGDEIIQGSPREFLVHLLEPGIAPAYGLTASMPQ